MQRKIFNQNLVFCSIRAARIVACLSLFKSIGFYNQSAFFPSNIDGWTRIVRRKQRAFAYAALLRFNDTVGRLLCHATCCCSRSLVSSPISSVVSAKATGYGVITRRRCAPVSQTTRQPSRRLRSHKRRRDLGPCDLSSPLAA